MQLLNFVLYCINIHLHVLGTNMLLEAVRHFRSVVLDVGSRVTTAHAHQCCIFQRYAKTVPSRMKWTMKLTVWTSIHDNGRVITACDVWLQQCIDKVCVQYPWPVKASECLIYDFTFSKKEGHWQTLGYFVCIFFMFVVKLTTWDCTHTIVVTISAAVDKRFVDKTEIRHIDKDSLLST